METPPAKRTKRTQSMRSAYSLGGNEAPSMSAVGAIDKRSQETNLMPLTGQTIQVKGVTMGHEGRQENIKSSEEGDKIMLVHTCWRENCGPATYVKLLDGGVVGVIASDINQDPDFQAYMHHAENFAEVESRGPHSYYGAWGMKIKYWPHIQFLSAPAVPDMAAEDWRRITDSIPEEDRQLIWQHILEKADGKCAISGSSGDPLVVVPVWEFETFRKEMQLTGFRAISVDLKRAQDNFFRTGCSGALALAVFMSMNRWSLEEVSTYREHQLKVLAERNNEDWSIDLYSVERIKSKYLALASSESLELTPEMLIGTPQQNEPPVPQIQPSPPIKLETPLSSSPTPAPVKSEPLVHPLQHNVKTEPYS